MENNQNDNNQKPTSYNLLIIGIVLCFLGPTCIIGVILIIMYIIKNSKNIGTAADFQQLINNKDDNQESKQKQSKKVSKCPSCGASIKKNETKCSYCDTNFE